MASSGLVTQIRKGVLEYCVLALLADKPRYGFELVQAFSRVDGMLTSEGTLYPLLSRLRKDELVETEWQESTSGPPRRYYRLTPRGDRALTEFRAEWATFRGAVDMILKGEIAP
jgi:PadR family transcriptional regulator, regulatory protein PadR